MVYFNICLFKKKKKRKFLEIASNRKGNAEDGHAKFILEDKIYFACGSNSNLSLVPSDYSYLLKVTRNQNLGVFESRV